MANERPITNTPTIAPTSHVSKWRRILAVVGVLVFAAPACGSSATTEEAANADQVESVSVDTAETEPADPAEEPEQEPGSESIDRSGLRVITYPALGGVRLGIPNDVLVSSEGDYMTMRRDASDGVVIFARTSQAAGDGEGVPIASIDDFISTAQAATRATVAVTDDSISVFGTELTRHEFREGEAPPGPGVFAARSIGRASNAWWTPAPMADVFLGEIEGGVLAVAATASTPEGLGAARSMINELLPTLELLTADGQPNPLPGEDDRYQTLGEPQEFAPATLDPDGAPEFTALFAPVEPATYQMGNLSLPITATFPPGWLVLPNVPTFVVLIELPPVGPGFRDVVFQQGVNAIVGVDLGPVENTPAVLVSDIAAFLVNPPVNLDISNLDTEATLGGLDAVRFDARIDPEATCQQDDPCQYMYMSADPTFTTMINPGVVHRTWWIQDVPAGPLVITASASEADAQWLDTRAEELMASFEFGSN